ncbi:MAG: sugar kinase [Candidatus Limnocylindria bacterium]
MSPDVVTVGEAMVLLVAEQAGPLREAATFRRHIAGAEANVAIGLCRLGHTAGWIGRVGDDEFGRAVLFRLRGEGVDVSRAVVDAGAPTGVLFREKRDAGPILVAYYRRGSAASRLSPDDLDAGYIRAARVLHLTGITPALSDTCRAATLAAAELARSAGVTVVLDPNVRLRLWDRDEARRVLRDLAAHSDIVLPGGDEAELMTEEADPEAAGRALLRLGPSLAVVKLGSRGALAVHPEGTLHSAPGSAARVIDPVGAGDAFAAGFIAGHLRELDLRERLDLANRCGAAAVAVAGDTEGMPRWEEVSAPPASPDVSR